MRFARASLLRGLGASGEWLIVAAQLIVVFLLLGLPDVGVALRFFAGQVPSEQATLALAGMFVWVAAAALTLGWLVIGVHRVRTRRTAVPHAGLVGVVLGLSLLGFGLLHHLGAASYAQCCGSLTTAQQLVSVAPGEDKP